MNLLMISGDRTLAAGKQGAFYNTLQELHKHFERIDIICPWVPVQRYDMSLFGNVYVHPSPLPLVFQWFWIWYKGCQLFRRHAFQMMTVHEYAPVFNGVGAALVHWRTRTPYVLEVMHVTGVPRAGSLWERVNRFLFRSAIRWLARPAVAVRVINQHQTPDFLESAGLPRSKFLYAPAFYIDLETFKPTDAPKQYDVVFVGRMARNKGLSLFLDVMEHLGGVGVAVGEGPLLGWAREQAKRRGLKIHFPGFAHDSAAVSQFLNASRVLLMPSLSEGGPRVVLEAMACGVPVVATPVGIVPDVLPPECIEEWNAADLAAKVKNVLSSKALYDHVQEAGLFTVRQFERTAAIKNYADELKKLMPSA